MVLPRYQGVELDGSARVYDDLRVSLGDAVLVRMCTWSRNAGFRSTWWIARRSTSAPACTATPGGLPRQPHTFRRLRRAALADRAVGLSPEVILHCHDWQTGSSRHTCGAPSTADPTFLGVKTLFTIHNLGISGHLSRRPLAEIALDAIAVHPGRAGVLREGQLPQGRHGVRRCHHYGKPDLRAGDPDSGVRLRTGWRAARARAMRSPAS